MRLVRTLLCSLSALLITVAVAQAQPPAQQRAQARELYANGQQLFRQGDFGGAQRAFEEAYRAVPNPVVLLSIAECYVRMEQYQKAIEIFRTYLLERANAPDRAQVEAQIQTLQAKPATLTVLSNVDGAEILIDQQDSGRVTPAELTLSPGEHQLTLRKERFYQAEQIVSLGPGVRDSVRIALTEEPQTPVAEAPAPEAVPEERGPRHPTPAFWAAIGVSAAGVVAGSVLGGMALKKDKEYNANDGENASTDLADKGERMALFCDVSFGVAAVGAVTALVVYLTSGSKGGAEQAPNEQAPSEQPTAWSVNPRVSRGNVGLSGELRF
jgi:tetratricopeptide (TPR) repeat protein